jgi:iron-sulfur cluster repair protein YtfE (RIC family)
MSKDIETAAQTRERRTALTSEVDFTMMYVAHDAFNRDLARLTAAAEAGDGMTGAAIATWRGFSTQLHTHHTAEDTALWPRLRAAITDPAEHAILEDMEREHAAIDPWLERIDSAIKRSDPAALAIQLAALARGLADHMRHEEEAALPLLERRLGQVGWDAFGKEIRERQGGTKAGAVYLPWVLDGAAEDTRAKVLKMLPGPARVLYRRIWEPKYRSSDRLHQ